MDNSFTEGPDPENPDDPKVDPEKMDLLITKVEEELRKVGLYGIRFTAITPEEENAHMYGIHRHRSEFDDSPLVILAALSIGDLAWTRVKTEENRISEELLRMEQSILDSDVEDLKKKYLGE